MLYLQFGDRLPSVGIVQRLINECRRTDTRCAALEELDEDGIFGPRTFAAVRDLQRALQVQPANGVVEPPTWRALATLRRCKVVDVTDLVLETMLRSEDVHALRERKMAAYLRQFPGHSRGRAELAVERVIRVRLREIAACRAQHDRFVAAGGEPIPVTALDNVFDTIRRGLEARSRDGSRVVLLRFTGHGSPASQGVAGSLYPVGSDINPDRLDFQPGDSAERIVETVVLGGMTMPMAPFGCVELHGCSVAGRRRVSRGGGHGGVDGPAFVQSFANAIERPVSASIVADHYGTLRLDTRYEGPVVSCTPGGGGVPDWFRRH